MPDVTETGRGDQPFRLGIFGGTFDPPHNGHVAVARFLVSKGLVDRLLVVPAGQPWLRQRAPLAPPEDRLAMARLAFGEMEGVEVSDAEVLREGPTYTIDTLNVVRSAADRDAHHVLVIGTDSARGIDQWHEYEQLLALCELLVVGRPGSPGLSDLPGDHPARLARYVEGPLVDVSATEVRRLLRAGKDVSGMVDGRVVDYIREHGLYGLDSQDIEGTATP